MAISGRFPQTFEASLPMRRHRPFGEVFPLPRRRYVFNIPLALFTGALVSWLGASDPTMLTGALVGSLCALYMLWEWLIRREPIRLSTLLAITMLLGYALGAVNTWFTLPRENLTLGQYVGMDDAILARGMAAVLLSMALLISGGELLERPLFGSEFRLPISSNSNLIVYASTLILIGAVASGKYSYMGSTAGDYGKVTVIGEFAAWLIMPAFAYSWVVVLSTRDRRSKLLLLLACIAQSAIMIISGRRTLIYSSVLLLFALQLTGYRMKGAFSKKMLLTAGLGGFVVVGGLFFMGLRIAGYQSGERSPSLTRRLEVMNELWNQGSLVGQVLERSQSNAQTRTFILTYLADVLEGSFRTQPAYGEDILNLSLEALPRAIYANKLDNPSEEQLSDEQFGLAYGDQPNSILTAGAIDFGLLGVIAYPVILVVVLRVFLNIVMWQLSMGAAVLLTLSIVAVVLLPELTATNYLLAMRDGVLFSCLFVVIGRLPAFRARGYSG